MENKLSKQEKLGFEIEGKPISQSRVRFSKGRVYDPVTSKKLEVKKILVSKIKQKDNIDENSVYFASNQFLSVNITFYTPIPKSCSKAKKIALEGMFDNNKPDVDNYVKFYLDAFNEIIYEDDKAIVALYAEKRKSCHPRVRVEIQSL